MKPSSLIEHPEGGRFCEVFKSDAVVVTGDGQRRSAITHIYFLLDQGEVSRFHRVSSDEIWNLYRGVGVRIYTWNGTGNQIDCVELSVDHDEFCHVVPAGMWQAAEPVGESVLVGCSVGPGFEYEDFTLMDANAELSREVCAIDPNMSRFVKR